MSGGVDLVAAVRQQEPFLRDMVMQREEFTQHLDVAVLNEYLNFMGHLRFTSSPVAPTPLVDLLWHTHQQHPQAYARECFLLAGRFIDHDDGCC